MLCLLFSELRDSHFSQKWILHLKFSISSKEIYITKRKKFYSEKIKGKLYMIWYILLTIFITSCTPFSLKCTFYWTMFGALLFKKNETCWKTSLNLIQASKMEEIKSLETCNPFLSYTFWIEISIFDTISLTLIFKETQNFVNQIFSSACFNRFRFHFFIFSGSKYLTIEYFLCDLQINVVKLSVKDL